MSNRREFLLTCGNTAVALAAGWRELAAQEDEGPLIKFGAELSLGQMTEGPQKVSIPPNAILSGLQLGKDNMNGPRWLNVWYRNNEGARKLELAPDEAALPTTTAPACCGGSAPIHIPDGTIVSAFQLGGGSLTVWYRTVASPLPAFKLGPDNTRPADASTKEPYNHGGGNRVSKEGYTIAGFQWLKDRDGTLALNVWYRQIL
jgi:hypothetical protein